MQALHGPPQLIIQLHISVLELQSSLPLVAIQILEEAGIPYLMVEKCEKWSEGVLDGSLGKLVVKDLNGRVRPRN